jgi:acyl-coenzyme A thioesterase PaaI-like protein
MTICELPFNKLIGLTESNDQNYILCLTDDQKYTNHLGTVHASALFSLAEGTSGQYLFLNFPQYKDTLIPVVRLVEVKYRKPAIGNIFSTATIIDATLEQINEQLQTRNRVSIKMKVDLFDSNKVCVMSADFEWFVSKTGANT